MIKIPRWSFITFFLILVIAVFAPMGLSRSPQETVAKPFAPPAWTGGDAPPPFSAVLSPSQGIVVLDWEWEAPENISIKGELVFEGYSVSKLVWTTPDWAHLHAGVLPGKREMATGPGRKGYNLQNGTGDPPVGERPPTALPVQGRAQSFDRRRYSVGRFP